MESPKSFKLSMLIIIISLFKWAYSVTSCIDGYFLK